MEKVRVIEEIRRIAAENEGNAPGFQRFSRETGIGKSDWYPKLWLRWSDALIEAGFEPNQFQQRTSDDYAFERYALLIRELGRVPVEGEVRVRASTDEEFPAHSVFNRYGGKLGLITALVRFCAERPEFTDVAELCKPYLSEKQQKSEKSIGKSNLAIGFVYLMKSGKHYKIGRTVSVEKREREIGLLVPELRKTVHWIETDDPSGVEAYWHRRFSDKRGNGEWFRLTSQDVEAFKRWKKIV